MPKPQINRSLTRRGLLKHSAAMAGVATAGLPTLTAFSALLGRPAQAALPDYGPLVPLPDEATGLPLLKLPYDFRYISYGWTTDPLRDGTPTPEDHDGMAVVQENGNKVILVRNHEIGSNGGPSFAPPKLTYDSHGRGGTTNLEFDRKRGEWRKSWVSLGGTANNCAGGPTPWGSWLTCEETLDGPLENINGGDYFPKQHGWVFEVPATGRANPQPIDDMGVFDHEACAVDPNSGFVYMTQDCGNDSGFYRFVPNQPGNLAAGGKLYMMAVAGYSQIDLTNSFTDFFGAEETVDVEWVRIDDPRQPHADDSLSDDGVFSQGFNAGGANFNALEGCWYEDGLIIFTDKSSNNRFGSVYLYNPFAEQLSLIIDFPNDTSDPSLMIRPDNITAHRNRDLLVCEDSSSPIQTMQFLTFDGQVFPFAENNVELSGQAVARGFSGDFRNREWAGATFTRDGEWLFANIQDPGITFAITGPWKDFVSTSGDED